MNKRLYIGVMAAVLTVAGATAQSRLRYQYDAAGNRLARVVEVAQAKQSPRLPGHGGEVAVSPTVTTDLVTITTTLDPTQAPMRYTVSDLQGRVLLSGGISGQRTEVSLGRHADGIYLLVVRHGSEVTCFRIVKQ